MNGIEDLRGSQVKELEQFWRDRLLKEDPKNMESIMTWLWGENRARLEQLNPDAFALAKQGIEYRYRILKQRYLGVSSTQAYYHLIERLGSLVTLRHKISAWIALSRERQRIVADIIQETIQDMLSSDRYIQNQIAWIAQCTNHPHLRNSLLLASLEEYCLRPIRNQPLLSYRVINFLNRQNRGGLTQVSANEILRLTSEDISSDESDVSQISLFDREAIAEYQETQNWEEQQALRLKVQQELESYLAENVSLVAVSWLRLYLQGRSPEAIALILGLPVTKVYRLREKVCYHALRVFTYKKEPELVSQWLDISLPEKNFGLTPKQWSIYWQSLTPIQRQIISNIKEGKNLKEICQNLNLKTNKIMAEWSNLYLSAQNLRNTPL